MSLVGIRQFDKNLKELMASKAFKKANDSKKLELGSTLLCSNFGLGRFFGYGKVCKLSKEKHEQN